MAQIFHLCGCNSGSTGEFCCYFLVKIRCGFTSRKFQGIRYEAYLEAQPIHPTFEEGDVRLERLEDDEEVPMEASRIKIILQFKVL